MSRAGPRRPAWRRALAYFDPAEPGYVGRLARVGLVLLAAGTCGLCGLLFAAGQVPLGRFSAGVLLLETGQSGPAERIALDLVAEHPGQAAYYYELLAAVYRRTGRQDQQLAVWDQAVQEMPASWSTHSHRCWFGSLFGDPQTVLGSCDAGVALAPPREGFGHARRALARLRLGDREGAAADLREALQRWEAYGGAPRWLEDSRRRWLQSLEDGENPLDEQTLRHEQERF